MTSRENTALVLDLLFQDTRELEKQARRFRQRKLPRDQFIAWVEEFCGRHRQGIVSLMDCEEEMSYLRILVVEDTQNWQEALSKILQRLGGDVQVDVAESFINRVRGLSRKCCLKYVKQREDKGFPLLGGAAD